MFFFMSFSLTKCRPLPIMAAIPSTIERLAMFDPIALPKARDVEPFKAADIDTLISGSEVTKAIIRAVAWKPVMLKFLINLSSNFTTISVIFPNKKDKDKIKTILTITIYKRISPPVLLSNHNNFQNYERYRPCRW